MGVEDVARAGVGDKGYMASSTLPPLRKFVIYF